MRFFIVKDENASYYYAPYRGIYRKNLLSLHSGEEVYPAASDGFALWRNSSTHIVCTNRNNDIMYIQYPRKPHLLIAGHEGIVPYDFTLTEISGRLNLFYKTDYNDRVLLYHCILGKSDKPYVITELSTDAPFYYCDYGKLFYTSPDRMLCCVLPENGKKTLTDMYDGGIMPCYTSDESRDLLVYKKDGYIYLNKRPMVDDKFAQSPLVFKTANAIYIQWLSGDFIRYKRMEKGIWSDTVQCMGTDISPHIINTVWDGHNHPCYGYNGRPSVKIL